MPTVQVTATSLNLRDGPSGNVIGLLERGVSLDVLDTQTGWLRVSAVLDGQTKLGWVNAQFVGQATNGRSSPPTSPLAIPMADDPQHPVTMQGENAIGPNGTSFARRWKAGYFTMGLTTLSSWLASGASTGDLSSSGVRVVRAVSLNEGRLEAVNSYDDAHLSFGMFQWTAGAGNGAGELAGLLSLIEQEEGAAFDDCFKRYGLGSVPMKPDSPIGMLTLNGQTLQSALLKDQLRSPEWAYRFWRAGHHDGVRRRELGLAGARLERFLSVKVQGFAVSDWLSSEFGVALILDEHVNRPGHVPGTLDKAIARLRNGKNVDPAAWTTADEAKLIALYTDEREKTNMTDPQGRALRIASCVHDQALSEQRGSYLAM